MINPVKISLTMNDYYTLSRHVEKKRGLIRKTILFSLLWVFFTVIGILIIHLLFSLHIIEVLTGKYNVLLQAIMTFIFWCYSGVVFSPSAARRFFYSKEFPSNGDFLRPQTLSIDYSGITSESELSKCFYNWKGIFSIDDTTKYIFLFYDGFSALTIPKRAFESEEAAKNFLKQARDFWERANPNSNKSDIEAA